jgi:hypothetical protein
MAFADDPSKAVQQRIQDLKKLPPGAADIDAKESDERLKAAEAYMGENEQHFVDYCEDCVSTSVQAMMNIRRDQAECWRVFNEEDPPNYANKEPWQSKVVVPKPFGAVQFAMSVVRKAFDVQFLSVRNTQEKKDAEFWQTLLETMLSRNYANFPIQFTDASGMGFAVGQSLEMIPVWRPGKGLRYVLTEPWKIHRDPDAVSRQPQSGMYWVHQEYLDYWFLREAQKKNQYQNVQALTPESATGADPKNDPHLTQQSINERKDQMWHRSRYRNMCLTSEFWGQVLKPNGDLLHPNLTYTVAAGRVVRSPKVPPYDTLRWPGISFSPIPHLLRYDGRGLIHGVKSLWYFMCSLMCLHNDNLNWVVNPMSELDVTALVDQTDIDKYPGKQYLTRGTVSGNQAFRTVDQRLITNEILANLNFSDMRFQEGTFVTNLLQGLPGQRTNITARESAQSLDQAMTIFSLIGKNLEDGALNAILAGAETIKANITYQELSDLMGEDVADQYRVDTKVSPTGLKLPNPCEGAYHVSGISQLMQDWEIIQNIRDLILPLFKDEQFIPYLKPYKLLQSLEIRLNLKDEGIIVDEDKATAIDTKQQEGQEHALDQAQPQQEATTAGLQNWAANGGTAPPGTGLPAIPTPEGGAAPGGGVAPGQVTGTPPGPQEGQGNPLEGLT